MGPMKTIDPSRFSGAAADHETLVRERLWDKVRTTLGRVPFADLVVAAYFAAVDPATPARVRAALFAALAYFVVPADMIPDVVAGLGYTDDLAVLLAAMRTVAPHIDERHRARAREVLAGGDRSAA